VLKLLKQKIGRAQDAPSRHTPEHFGAAYSGAAEPSDRQAEPPKAAPSHVSYHVASTAPAVPQQARVAPSAARVWVLALTRDRLSAQVASEQRRISVQRDASADALQEKDALIRELRETNEARLLRVGCGTCCARAC
jgi:hypothetical protein